MDTLRHRRLFAGATEAPLLLDKIAWTYAVEAFAYRRLRLAYTGSLVRLRRSSDNKEADFGWDSTGWLSNGSLAVNGSDSSLNNTTLASFFSGTDGYITTRFDQSQYTRNATQSTSVNQPKLVSSGALLTGSNGRPAATYDGLTQYLVTAGFAVSQPLTLSMVMLQTSHASVGEAVIDSDTTGGRMLMMQYLTSPQLTVFAGSYSPQNSNLAIGAWGLVTGIWNSSSSVLQINGGSDATGNPGTPGITSAFSIGATTGGAAATEIRESEVVVWSIALSSTQRSIQRADINVAYALF